MSVSALVSMLPSGISNDFFTSRRLASIALVVMLISFYLLPLTNKLSMILLIMIVIGIGRELFRLSRDIRLQIE
jgi:hypothetical protein